ncbi:MAG: cation:proton antiporter [Clostridia bacterium]|nr:cation:proton antiporter [Clostridia bacterium]
MSNYFVTNLSEVVAIILFGIGFSNLLLARNLVKKIIGMNIMDTAIYLFLAAKGYVQNSSAPIVSPGPVDVVQYVNPVPSGLVLTGIVVSVSVSAVLLALTVRLYEEFGTLDIDEIVHKIRKQDKEELL